MRKIAIGFVLVFAFAILMTSSPDQAFAAVANGELIVDNGTVYKIQFDGGVAWRQPFRTVDVYKSHGYEDFSQVRKATAEDMSSTREGWVMAYRDGSLVKGPSHPLVYLVSNGEKLPFSSANAFLNLGYKFDHVKTSNIETFADLKLGSTISSGDIAHRVGALINNNGTIELITTRGRVAFDKAADFLRERYNFEQVVPANDADRALARVGIAEGRASTSTSPSAGFYTGATRISSVTCGESYTFKVDNYDKTKVWIIQNKSGTTTADRIYDIPDTYTSICGKDEGTYTNEVYGLNSDNTKGARLASASFEVKAKAAVVISHVPSAPTVTLDASKFVKNLTKTFSAVSTDPDGDLVTYTFDWDDGSTKFVKSEDSGKSVSGSHAWTKAGTYAVKVKASDDRGNFAERITTIIVHDAELAALAVTTTDATDITSAGAVLNGSVVGNTSGWLYFLYGTDKAAMYDFTAFKADTGGPEDRKFWTTVTDLKANTIYYFRAAASSDSSGNSVKGEIEEFKTGSDTGYTLTKPTITGPTSVLTGSNNLYKALASGKNFVASPGYYITYSFNWGDGSAKDTKAVELGYEVYHTWKTAGIYTITVTATDSLGASTTNTLQVKVSDTGTVPTVTTNAATGMTSFGATLNASVNPNGGKTEAWFQYGTIRDILEMETAKQSIGYGTSNVIVNANVTGLLNNTTYYFRAVASDANGKAYYGDILSFKTTSASANAPIVTTVAVDTSTIIPTGATLQGTVNPNGSAVEAWFEHGTDSTLSSSYVTSVQNLTAGTINVNITAPISGLSSNTKYYYRAIAAKPGAPDSERTKGSILNFTTTSSVTTPPAVTTSSAEPGITTAVFKGNVNPNGTLTSVYFRYGVSATFLESQTTAVSQGSGTSVVDFTATGISLAPNSTYSYQAVASYNNGLKLVYGDIKTFTTKTGGELRGKTLKDDDGDQVQDSGEKYILDPTSSVFCSSGYYYLGSVVISYTGPATGTIKQTLCSSSTGDPIYSVPNLKPGSYTVSIAVPAGWQVVGTSSRTVTISADTQTTAIFYIKKN